MLSIRLRKHILWICLLITLMTFNLAWICFAGTNNSTIGGMDSDFAFAKIPDTETIAAAIDLNGTWQFKATDEEEWMDARVPGTVWTDLLRVGRVEDPFYRDNELKVQWVEKKSWENRRTFQVDEEFLKHDRIILDCRGLDTIAEVYLNGQLVAKTYNMFIEYEFDVKPILRVGENEIHIIFRDILKWNKEEVAKEPRIIWVNEKGRNFFTRKEGSDFGWDWGVRLVTSGVWRSIRLAAYDRGRIIDLGARQDLTNPKKAILDVTAEIERFADKKFNMRIEVLLDGEVVSQKNVSVSGKKVSQQLSIKNPKLWWPNGWGDQPLYTVKATLVDGKEVVHSRKIRIGLRTVELVRERDERGETFGIKINGHLIFCKGGNWLPLDALPDRLTEAHYKYMLSSCVEANMNMFRLWAGGLYEAEVFYDYCDEHGIMLFHDFMYAVGPFLATESFLASVREEIAHIVRRLRHHPSIVLWCGNNEIESSMPRTVKQWETVTWEDYDKIFNGAIPNTLAKYETDSGRPYWPGSPHHPLNRERDSGGFEAESGDAHIWDVWHGGNPFVWFEDHADMRFVSEYGLQSYPTMETIRSFTLPEDRRFGSRILLHHNKCEPERYRDGGDTRIARLMAREYGLPKGFENFVYVSHILHGESMKISTEAYRRNFPYTTGALYWQVNDNWPTTSGSGIDYYGRWKACHYLLRHVFAPILVSGKIEEKTKVKIWGVNEKREEVPAKFQWVLANLDGTEVKSGEKDVLLPANNSTVIAEFDFTKEVGEHPDHHTYRMESHENRRNYYLSYKLAQGDEVLSSNVEFFDRYRYLALPEPGLNYKIEKDGENLFVEISSRKFAAYVELGLKKGYARFSDNYFHLLPGETKKVVVVESEIPERELVKQLYVKSLIDSYL